MTAVDRKLWRELLRERCGHGVVDSRIFFLERRLWERMRVLGMTSFSVYHRFVSIAPGGEREWRMLVEELVNRESGFFRHLPSFEILSRRLLPDLLAMKRRQGERTLSLWSAGCSGGQEAYSIAMSVLDVVDPRAWDVQILATDLSEKALVQGRAARYRESEIRTLPDRYRQRYMIVSGRNGSSAFQIRSEVTTLVQFEEGNLHRPVEPRIPLQDVIFCQNVLIYFDPVDRLDTLSRLCERLKPGGYLLLAPGEVVGFRLAGIRSVSIADVLVYQRTPWSPPREGAESERPNGTQD